MPILPVDTSRYGTLEMRRIFEEENRLQKMLDVEAALAWAHGAVESVPREDAERIVRTASIDHVKLRRVKEIEREIKHETMAVVRALVEACGPSGGYVHLGAASSDILDTAMSLQLREGINLIEQRLNDFEKTLMEKAEQHKDMIMIGRTHGQHALPITLGFKFSVWMREIARHIERLRECRKRVLVGKMSGAVGTQAGFGPHAMKIQRLVMERLGIEPVEISTQIIQRDRYAELVCLFAILASTLDKIATEIRELQRTEIGEVSEPFEKEKQVGSSTMPHKRNPIICERVSGLAKIVRSLALPALENVPTWHERDLTPSSAERFIIPETFILTDYMLTLIMNVLTYLYVDKEGMRKNVELTQGRTMSEAVMLTLTRKGVGRQRAHELIRVLTIKSEVEKLPFGEVLLKNDLVKRMLSQKEINEALDPRNYLGTALEQVEFAIKKTKQEREDRGLPD